MYILDDLDDLDFDVPDQDDEQSDLVIFNCNICGEEDEDEIENIPEFVRNLSCSRCLNDRAEEFYIARYQGDGYDLNDEKYCVSCQAFFERYSHPCFRSVEESVKMLVGEPTP